MQIMTRFMSLAFAAALAAAPVAAQDSSDEGRDLMQEGVDRFFRGLMDELRPPMEEIAGIGARHLLTLQAIAQEMGPAFAEVFDQIDSITYYEPPTFLPNGDIILRRTPTAPEWEPPVVEEEPEAEPRLRVEPGADLEL